MRDDQFKYIAENGRYSVAFRKRHVDHMDVTNAHSTYVEAMGEAEKLSKHSDILFVRVRRPYDAEVIKYWQPEHGVFQTTPDNADGWRAPNPWHPITDTTDLKVLGKAAEELGECTQAVGRCIIQGLDGIEPTKGTVNRDLLQNEVADVYANLDLIVDRFNLNKEDIEKRRTMKKAYLRTWHDME